MYYQLAVGLSTVNLVVVTELPWWCFALHWHHHVLQYAAVLAQTKVLCVLAGIHSWPPFDHRLHVIPGCNLVQCMMIVKRQAIQ